MILVILVILVTLIILILISNSKVKEDVLT